MQLIFITKEPDTYKEKLKAKFSSQIILVTAQLEDELVEYIKHNNVNGGFISIYLEYPDNTEHLANHARKFTTVALTKDTSKIKEILDFGAFYYLSKDDIFDVDKTHFVKTMCSFNEAFLHRGHDDHKTAD